MPTVKIPIWLGSNKNVDEFGLGGLSAELRDAFIDELQNVRKRPGIQTLINLNTSAKIDGLYWWEKQNVLVAVSNQTVYQISESGGVYSSNTYSYAAADKLAAGTKVVFADFGSVLYAANGGKIFKIPASTGTSISALGDVDAPTQVTHIAHYDSYLICNNGAYPTQFYWSKVSDPDTWEGAFATAEAHIDDLVGLSTANKLIYLFGTKSVEVWYDDGVTPFVPLSQGIVWTGTIAKRSICWCRDTFYWIDESRNLVKLVGNSVKRLPEGNEQSLSQYLQSLTTVSDAEGEYIFLAGRELYVLQLPTEDITIVYDLANNTWAFWSVWSSLNSAYSRWFGNVLTYSDAWNKRLLGHKDNGYIYEFSTELVTDGASSATYVLDQNGDIITGVSGSPLVSSYGTGGTTEPIRTQIRTGQINHETESVRKQSAKYTLICKRTGTIDASLPSISVKLRWRDNGSPTWSDWKYGSIETIDETTFRMAWRRNGQYYSRQLEIVNDDPAPLLIVNLEETFDYGR